MKEFFSSFFSSANIIVRAKVYLISSVSALLPLRGAWLRSCYPRVLYRPPRSRRFAQLPISPACLNADAFAGCLRPARWSE